MNPPLKLLFFKTLHGATDNDDFIRMEIDALSRNIDYGKRRVINSRASTSFFNDDHLTGQILLFYCMAYGKQNGPILSYLKEELRSERYRPGELDLALADSVLRSNLESLGVDHKSYPSPTLHRVREVLSLCVPQSADSPSPEPSL
jgi:hypothetical protein